MSTAMATAAGGCGRPVTIPAALPVSLMTGTSTTVVALSAAAVTSTVIATLSSTKATQFGPPCGLILDLEFLCQSSRLSIQRKASCQQLISMSSSQYFFFLASIKIMSLSLNSLKWFRSTPTLKPKDFHSPPYLCVWPKRV